MAETAETVLARQMPPVQHARINGVDLAYYEAGREHGGVPIVLCHGFPELAYSWRRQIEALAAAGRWVVAPDQRGYGLTGGPGTGGPEAVTDYDMAHLTGDLVGLLDHLGADKAVWAGHDWGGIIVWQMPLLHPARTAGVIGVNTPQMPRPPADPIEIMRRRMGDEMYIVHFQKPGEADAVLNADAAKSMNFFLRKAPGGPTASKGFGEEAKDGQSAFALVRVLEAWSPEFDPREPVLPPEEQAVFAEAFARTGFTGGINWYRNFTRNWEMAEGLPTRIDGVPCLMVMADGDAVLPPSAADGMEDRIGDLEKRLVTGSGHWTQQEQPEQLNAILIDWLDRRFPKRP